MDGTLRGDGPAVRDGGTARRGGPRGHLREHREGWTRGPAPTPWPHQRFDALNGRFDDLYRHLLGASAQSPPPGAAPAGVLAANAPAVDAVTMFVSRDLSLGFRRGWTHGVLAMAVLPLVLTVPARARPGGGAVGAGRRHGAGPLLQLTSAGVLGQPLLDWLNTYGVRFLMPFDGTWFYGDALFIIDFIIDPGVCSPALR